MPLPTEPPTEAEEIDMSDEKLGDEIITAVAELLETKDCAIKEVYLDGNEITDDGAERLAAALSQNSSVIVLSLMQNKITDQGGVKIAEVLSNNSSLTSIDFRDNQVSDQTAVAFSTMLETNSSLKTLYLKDNDITNVGGLKFCELLEKNINKTLKHLDLECNLFEADVVTNISTVVGSLRSEAPEVNTGYQKVGFRATGYKKEGTSEEVIETKGVWSNREMRFASR